MHLIASSSYDPVGGDGEHDELVSNATDGNAQTSWSTERYGSADFGGLKDGVGLVLDAGVASSPSSITVVSDTPGLPVFGFQLAFWLQSFAPGEATFH